MRDLLHVELLLLRVQLRLGALLLLALLHGRQLREEAGDVGLLGRLRSAPHHKPGRLTALEPNQHTCGELSGF